MASNTTTTQDSQDHKPLNYIDVLDENIQGLIGEYLSPYQSYDWELACQGEEVLAMIEKEYYQEDETRDWRDDPRRDWEDWEDDFDLYQEWEQDNEDDMYEDYGDCYVNEYGERVHNARFSADGYLAR